MNSFIVVPKISLCSLVITLVTLISHTFMDRFHVESHTVLSCGIVITLVTSISYTFMDDLFMSFKIAFIRIFEPTVVTRISNTFMFIPEVLEKSGRPLKIGITLFTIIPLFTVYTLITFYTFYALMNRFFMYFKIALCLCFILTTFTGITNTVVFYFFV